MMRDNLCLKSNCMELIDFYSEFVDENKEKISKLWEDIENDVQRFPADNKKIIEGTHETNILYLMDIIRAKYSIGQNVNTIERYFLRVIKDLENIREKKIGYLNLLWMVSLGILLETDKENKKNIENTHEKNIIYLINIIRDKYSIGQNFNTIDRNFLRVIKDLENIREKEIDYLNLLWMVSLGILLETDKENIKRLSE